MSSTYYDELGYRAKPMGQVKAKQNSKVIPFVTPSGYKLDGFKIVDILDIETANPIIEVIGDSGRPVRLRVPRSISVWYPSEGLSSSYNKLTHNVIVLDAFLTKNDKDIGGNVTDERMYQKFKDGKYNKFTYNRTTTQDTDSDGVFIAYDDINSMFAEPSTLLDSKTMSTIYDWLSPRKWEEPIQEILTSEEEQAKQAKQAKQDESGHVSVGGKRRSKSNNKKPKKSAKRSKRSKSRRTRRQRK